jgi:hypothetical protein
MDPLSPLEEFKSKLFHVHAKDMIVHPERLNEVGIFAFPKEWHTPRIPGNDDGTRGGPGSAHGVAMDGPALSYRLKMVRDGLLGQVYLVMLMYSGLYGGRAGQPASALI